jgi:hypothetical protein
LHFAFAFAVWLKLSHQTFSEIFEIPLKCICSLADKEIIMTRRANQPHRKEARRDAAKERQRLRDERGDAGQLNRLISKGHPHCKEARRLRG